LGLDKNSLEIRINTAKNKKILEKNQADILHELRKFRNKICHPTEEKLDFEKEKIIKWADAVFAIKENVPKKDDKK
jgi:uncharacterized protein YutE (UPF0331/DUF86 family)